MKTLILSTLLFLLVTPLCAQMGISYNYDASTGDETTSSGKKIVKQGEKITVRIDNINTWIHEVNIKSDDVFFVSKPNTPWSKIFSEVLTEGDGVIANILNNSEVLALKVIKEKDSGGLSSNLETIISEVIKAKSLLQFIENAVVKARLSINNVQNLITDVAKLQDQYETIDIVDLSLNYETHFLAFKISSEEQTKEYDQKISTTKNNIAQLSDVIKTKGLTNTRYKHLEEQKKKLKQIELEKANLKILIKTILDFHTSFTPEKLQDVYIKVGQLLSTTLDINTYTIIKSLSPAKGDLKSIVIESKNVTKKNDSFKTISENEFKVKGSFKTSFSLGPAFTFNNRSNNGVDLSYYKIQDSPSDSTFRIGQHSEKNIGKLELAAMMHFYGSNSPGKVKLGAVLGLGASIKDNTLDAGIYAGGSVIFGSNENIILSAGVRLHNVNRLKTKEFVLSDSNYKVNNKDYPNALDISSVSKKYLKAACFLSLTYSLSKRKTDE